MTLDDITDPLLRDAAERFEVGTGKPLRMWIAGKDEAMLRQLLIRHYYLTEAERRPFDPDELAVRLALRGFTKSQRKGLAHGDAAFIELAAQKIVEYFRRNGIKLQHGTNAPEQFVVRPRRD